MLYLLYESPLGLALFKKKEYDEVASDTTQLLQAVKSMDTFSKMVKLAVSGPHSLPGSCQGFVC